MNTNILYSKPKFGTIHQGSEHSIEGGKRREYNGYEIEDAEAYYIFQAPIHGKNGATRNCWIVYKNNRKCLVMDGTEDDVERKIDEMSHSKPAKPAKKTEPKAEEDVQNTEEQIFKVNKPRTKRRIGIQRRL